MTQTISDLAKILASDPIATDSSSTPTTPTTPNRVKLTPKSTPKSTPMSQRERELLKRAEAAEAALQAAKSSKGSRDLGVSDLLVQGINPPTGANSLSAMNVICTAMEVKMIADNGRTQALVLAGECVISLVQMCHKGNHLNPSKNNPQADLDSVSSLATTIRKFRKQRAK